MLLYWIGFYITIATCMLLGFIMLFQRLLYQTRQYGIRHHLLKLDRLEIAVVTMSALSLLILRLAATPSLPNMGFWFAINLQLLVLIYSCLHLKTLMSYIVLTLVSFICFVTTGNLGILLFMEVFLMILAVIALPEFIQLSAKYTLLFHLAMTVLIGTIFWFTLQLLSITTVHVTITMIATFIVASVFAQLYNRFASSDSQPNETLAYAAYHDALTSVKNWSAFRDEFNRSFTANASTGLVIATLDIDHFKAINDQYGHLVGNQVLVVFANTMIEALRPYHFDNYFYRTGGEEFSIIFPRTDLATANMICDVCQAQIRQLKIPLQGNIISLTASIGLTEKQAHDRDATATFQRADHYLYLSKQHGRNRTTNTEFC
ncbi:GGDEF domain-containing protein [Secundilactobacillus odoratitofui]|uniref:GGDEF domain-containing protein n=2 Tax=Secundilactobacillus odoratitofui TaxID=480930 RepID=UPI0007050B96|nr:GGDEF domain-containing protein [Secundilactobacillus odoratitofui]